MTKTKALLREKVWWPGMSSYVETLIKPCYACQVINTKHAKCQPLQMSEILKRPRETLAMDLKGPFPTSQHLLVIIDYSSRYLVAALLDTITSAEIIRKLKDIFAIFGYPTRVTADNGQQLNSDKFKAYLKQLNIYHCHMTPYCSSADGEVERFNRTLSKALQTSHTEGKNWKNELNNFLLQYRTTLHCITRVPPATVLLKYNIKNSIPSFDKPTNSKLDTVINKRNHQKKANINEYANSQRKSKPLTFKKGEQIFLKSLRRNNKLQPF